MSAIYLETSFISSYVTDRMDAASVYRRQTAREWWSSQKSRHEVWISEEVLTELSHPSFTRSAAALELTQDVPLLPLTDDVRGLARLLVREKVMPGPVRGRCRSCRTRHGAWNRLFAHLERAALGEPEQSRASSKGLHACRTRTAANCYAGPVVGGRRCAPLTINPLPATP